MINKIIYFLVFVLIGYFLYKKGDTLGLKLDKNKNNKLYGYKNLNELKTDAKACAINYPYGANYNDLAKLLLETAIVETDGATAYMDVNRNYGRSIMQLDKIGYEEALRIRVLKKNKNYAKEIESGYMSDDLQYNIPFAMYLARFFYLGKPEKIPDSIEGRAKYWKKYYNTSYGAGTPEKYISLVNKWLGANYDF